MLTVTAAVTIWVAFGVILMAAVHTATSKRYPSPPGEGPEESVFDIEDYQWRDVA